MKKYLIFAVLLLAATACKKQTNFLASGTFEATEVIVSAEGNGRLLHFDFWEGDLLDSNRLAAAIDTVQLYLKREQLIQTGKATGYRRQDIAKQIAATEEQIETQKRELNRFSELVKKNAANQKQVDDINAQIKVLQKQLAAQKSSLSLSNQSVSEDKSGIDLQIAQIDDQIRKCLVRSPISGTILAKYAQAGELAATGKALFKVADMENLFLRAYITSDQLSQLKVGQSVKVRSDWDETGERLYDGIITWVAGKSEFTPKTILTRNERANTVYAVKVAVKNDGYLKIGMYGEIIDAAQ